MKKRPRNTVDSFMAILSDPREDVLRHFVANANMNTLDAIASMGRLGRNATKHYRADMRRRVADVRNKLVHFHAERLNIMSETPESYTLKVRILSIIGNSHKPEFHKFLKMHWGVIEGINDNSPIADFKNALSERRRNVNGPRRLPVAMNMAVRNDPNRGIKYVYDAQELLRDIATKPLSEERTILDRIQIYLRDPSMRSILEASEDVLRYLVAAKARHLSAMHGKYPLGTSYTTRLEGGFRVAGLKLEPMSTTHDHYTSVQAQKNLHETLFVSVDVSLPALWPLENGHWKDMNASPLLRDLRCKVTLSLPVTATFR
jgi:hypothetical protein